jgi:dTDP-4-amino-4,6-dideoxygalactose transaminase
MFYRLPPAGDPIVSQPVSSPGKVLKDFFSDYTHRFYDSGTSALAAALIAAIKVSPKPNPEVLIPAYTCPALVSAALFAGARPVLVDLEPDRPWMNLEDLKRKISPQTVAVIAVHLFGIPERLSMIEEITKSATIFLVEDSAQYIPEKGRASWRGDFVILSFGRGKPVSLLGGGAVLAKTPVLSDALPVDEAAKGMGARTATFRSRIWLYNAFLSPRLYWLPTALPFLHLGETRFTPLRALAAPGSFVADVLPRVLDAYKRRPRDLQEALSGVLTRFESRRLIDLPKACCGESIPRLVRYPLLVSDTALRNRLFEVLDRAGLGVSKMYPATLRKIPGLEKTFPEISLPNAERFAGGVLTLPLHSGVTAASLRKIDRVFGKVLTDYR